MIALTREAGEFVARLRFAAIPAQGIDVMKNGFTDCAAAIVLGRNEPVVSILRATLPSGGSEARVCLGDTRAGAVQAAFVNGAAAHALDYDDIGLNEVQPTHPSAVLVPAVLAEAEVLGRGGRDMLEAYAAGYEVWGEIAARDRRPHHVKGWHPTATFGAIAAAAAAARLRGLDAARAAHALGIAASQAGGVVANFGSMTKPFHAGRAASAGVFSARLAAAGMSASPQALEHPQGFLHAVSPAGEVDLDTPVRLGRNWRIVEDPLGFKLYPMCYGTHRALDSIIALARERDIAPARIASVEIQAGAVELANLVHHDPRTALHAKFSMEFAAAMALIARRATLAEVDDAFVLRADVRELMGKVRITVLPEPAWRKAPQDGVVVTLEDGARLERRFELPMGHPKRPVGVQALWAKFADCVKGALSQADARRMFEALQGLEALGSVGELPVAGA
ncbi:MAG: MmgE/PrpD family protein [Burkholderiales bacterium]|nr:MmgE/PrpD family protein [Burkholderiales bacterium]